MPRKSQKEVVPAKRERLTLSQLASYDDILTDALVDHVYFWSSIRKNRSKYNLARGVSENDVTTILLHDLIVGKEPQLAESKLLMLPGLKKFVDKLRTVREKEDFKRHLRRYLSIWSTDCPWEVSTTNRYTITTHEASVTARRPIRKGETIKYLAGNLVAMTPEEEKDLDLTRRDFSIVMSSRKKTPSLFLGPARFANHDCDANAKLVTTGSDSMQVVAIKDIELCEEVTVTYGEDYFGIDNCECLCGTCERLARNGWTPSPTALADLPTVTSIEDEPERPYSLRNKRKFNSPTSSSSATPEVESRPIKRVKISKVQQDVLPNTEVEKPIKRPVGRPRKIRPPEVPSEANLGATATAKVPANTKKKLSCKPSTPLSSDSGSKLVTSESGQDWSSTIKQAFKYDKMKHNTTPKRLLDDLAISMAKRQGQAGHDSDGALDSERSYKRQKRLSSIPLSFLDGSQGEPLPSDADSVFDRSNDPVSTPSSTPATSDNEVLVKDEATLLPSEAKLVATMTEKIVKVCALGTNSEQTKLEIVEATGKKTKRKYTKRKFIPIDAIEGAKVVIRYPGDYILVDSLLSEPHSRWVDCKTCANVWVQLNGYCTRKECPRCERHSKLYGFQWPQTDPKKGDKIGRVMDHRTVHRFLGPDEERVNKRFWPRVGGRRSWSDGRSLTREIVEEAFSADGRKSSARGSRLMM